MEAELKNCILTLLKPSLGLALLASLSSNLVSCSQDILDEDDFLDPFGALTKVKARKIIKVIFISNFVSSLQCFAGLA